MAKRIRITVFLCLISVLAIGTFLWLQTNEQQNTSRYKFIEFGWDMPSPAFLHENIQQMEQQPFDGVVVRLNAGLQVFQHTAYPADAFAQDQADLAATSSTRLTHNFVLMWATCEEGWNWYSDDDWASAESNIRNFARTAAAGRFKGIVFDPETYGWSPWRYDETLYAGYSFADVEGKVRERAARFISVLQEEMPNADILALFFGGSIVQEHYDRGENLPESNYALYRAFVEGMLAGANDTVHFIDGNESSYFYTHSNEFIESREWNFRARDIIGADYRASYDAHVQMGQAIYVDSIMNLWASPRIFGYYLASDEERLQLLEHNVYDALRASDEYVWIYSENIDWWRGDIPEGVAEAVVSARQKVEADELLGFDVVSFVDAARAAYDARVIVSGSITRNDGTSVEGVAIVSGISLENHESACVVFQIDRYDCIVPSGWSGTITPVLLDAVFEPESQSFANLTQNTTLDFVVSQ